MKLDESQTKLIAAWINEGATLSEIQTRISEQFGISMTYMETRFLVDDLDLELRDSPQPEATTDPQLDTRDHQPEAATEPDNGGGDNGVGDNNDTPPPPTPERISVTVDPVQRAGVLAGGTVKFSDGTEGRWLLDEMGRLGLEGFPAGYRVPPQDVPEFQIVLRRELSKLGY